MLAYEVFVNGRKATLAGADDLSVLSSIVSAVGKLGRRTSRSKGNRNGYDLWLSVGGLTGRKRGLRNEHLDWTKQRKLKVGDEVRIVVCQVSRAEKPIGRKFSDSKETERHQFEWAKRTYLRLQKKYEKPRANPLLHLTRGPKTAARR